MRTRTSFQGRQLWQASALAEHLRDMLGAETVERLCAVEVARVHQIAQQVGPPAESSERRRLLDLADLLDIAPATAEEAWLLAPNAALNGSSPCLCLRAGRRDLLRCLAAAA